jgi:hypothetical protein
MPVTVASLQAILSLDAGAFQKGIKGADKDLTKFQKAMGGVNSTLGQFGVQLGAAGAIAGFGAEMGKMIQLGSNAEETFSKFNNIFGTFADTTRAELDAFGAAVGRNKFELQEFAAGFGALVTGMGMGGQEAGAFSTELVKLTTDLSSFHNVAEADVAEALRAGIIGETEPLRKFGVVLNQAAVNSELLRMGIDGGAKAATEAEKAQARLNLILAATSTAQNDAAETSGSFANQMRALQAAIAEAETEIGQKLLPVVTPLVKTFAQLAKEELPGVVSGFNSLARLGDGINTLTTSITALGVAMGILSEKADPVTSKFSILGKLVEISMLPYQGLGDALKFIGLGFQLLGAELSLVTGKWTSFNNALSTTASLLPGLGNITANSPVPLAEGLKAIRHEINTMPSLAGAFGLGGAVPSAAGAGGNTTNNYYSMGGQQLGPFNGSNGGDEAIKMVIQILRQQLAGAG